MKNRLFLLPEEIVDIILEYHNPYRVNYNKTIKNIDWINGWYIFLSTAVNLEVPFYRWILIINIKLKNKIL